MRTHRIRTTGRIGLAGLIVAAAMGTAAVEAQQQPYQAQLPAPAPAAPGTYAAPLPAELFASNLGIYYRLEPYGGSQGARLSRPPVPGSPAGQIQLETGDLIVALDNLPIYGPNDVLNHSAQTSVQFVNIRTGQPQTNWVFIPTTTPPPGGGTPPPYPLPTPIPTPPATLPYSLGVATMLAPIGNDQVYASPLPGQPTPYLTQRPTYGLRVTQVVPGSAAHRVGLEVGDIIVSANGVPMGDANALRRAIAGSAGALNLVVRDVRVPGREVRVYAPLDPTGGQVYASPAPPQ